MKNVKAILPILLTLTISPAFAQQSAPTDAATKPAHQAWSYQTKELNRTQIDALLAKPEKVLIIDVRRPDEVVTKGSFPVFLNVQVDELKNQLASIPKDRAIITVSNRAHRAGAAGDILAASGFKVAGAAGTQDYEEQGGTIKRIVPPAPKQVSQK